MGTKVHREGYFSGYHFTRDLNEDASTGCWPLVYEDKMLKGGQYLNGFRPMPMDGYSEDNKELLKRTMLEHEAIFRNQVYELHRLYRIQRDLMNELQRKELYAYSMQTGVSLFSPFSSIMPSRDFQNICQSPSMHVESSAYSRPSFFSSEDKWSPFRLLKESEVQQGPATNQNFVGINGSESMDSRKNFQKNTFDLQLPADVYIDNDDVNVKEKSYKVSLASSAYCQYKANAESQRDMIPALGTGEKPSYRGDYEKDESNLSNGQHAHYLADLNEPAQVIFNEGDSASCSVAHSGSMACYEGTQGQQLSMKQSLSILDLCKDFVQDSEKIKDKKGFSNSFRPENKEKIRECQFYNPEPGKTSAFCHEKLPLTSGQLLGTKKSIEMPFFLASDQGKRSSWLQGKAACADASNGISVVDIRTSPAMESHHPAVSLSGDTSTAFSSVPCRSKFAGDITAIPIAETLPWLNGSSPLNRQLKSTTSCSEKWDLNVCSRLELTSLSEMPCQNDRMFGLQSEVNASPLQFLRRDKLDLNEADCSSYCNGNVYLLGKMHDLIGVKSVEDMNLNQGRPNVFKDEIDSQHDTSVNEVKGEDELKVRCGFQMKETHKEPASNGGLAQREEDFCFSQEFELKPLQVKTVTENGSPAKDLFSALLQSKEGNACRTQLADCSNSKIFGFPISQNSPQKDPFPHSSSMSSLVQSQIIDPVVSKTEAVFSIDVFSKPTAVLNLEEKPFAEACFSETEHDRSSSGHSEHINLNHAAIGIEEQTSDSLDHTSKENRVVLSSVPEDPSGSMPVKDMEAVTFLSHVEDVFHESKNIATNHPVKHAKPILCEQDNSLDTLARMAAESIVSLSSCVCSCSSNASSMPSSSALRDSLVWLSEVFFSNTEELDSTEAGLKDCRDASCQSLEDSVDFFESMTLKLTETRVEVPCWKPWDQDSHEKEDTGASALLTQTRKMPRRGRQRRDFQKDILPGLVSLSRHEVTEDFQTFGVLMRASGFSWHARAGKRNAAKNGLHCWARGRRRPRASAAPAGAGSWIGLLQKQLSNSEIEQDGGLGLQGWGKTTRRCRRPRITNGNSTVIST